MQKYEHKPKKGWKKDHMVSVLLLSIANINPINNSGKVLLYQLKSTGAGHFHCYYFVMLIKKTSSLLNFFNNPIKINFIYFVLIKVIAFNATYFL